MVHRRLPAVLVSCCALMAFFWAWSWRDVVHSHHGRLLLLHADPKQVRHFLLFRSPGRSDDDVREAARARQASGYLWSDVLEGSEKTAGWSRLGFEYHHGRVGPGPFRFDYQLVAIPYWSLMLPLASITAASVFRSRRARRRARLNQCTQCGYDLRGSSDRCPECGNAPPRSLDTPQISPKLLPPEPAGR